MTSKDGHGWAGDARGASRERGDSGGHGAQTVRERRAKAEALVRLVVLCGHWIRGEILLLLSDGPRSASALARAIEIDLPDINHHLAPLEEGGLVSSEKRGRVRMCALKAAPRPDGSIVVWERAGVSLVIYRDAEGDAPEIVVEVAKSARAGGAAPKPPE